MINFDHTNKSYMHNPEFVLEYEAHALLWDFEIQTDHIISARQPDLKIVQKKKKKKKSEPAELWTLPFLLNAGWNGKKAKREIGTLTLLEEWKHYWTWR